MKELPGAAQAGRIGRCLEGAALVQDDAERKEQPDDSEHARRPDREEHEHLPGLAVGMSPRRRGQAVVEFALGAAVFFLLMLGTFDLARAYLAYTVVANAARESARYGAAHTSDANWTSAATRAGVNIAVGIEASALVLTPSTATIDGLPYISVTGTYLFHTLTPFVRALLGDPISIQVQTSALAG
ncbi:MAG: hypothetical protein NVSMB2_11410 [Chloroflexota bacterium]